jgi:hypothetical protein
LMKHDLSRYWPMFALYLDIQKQLDIEELEEGEIKGRWKSYVNKWYARHLPIKQHADEFSILT